MNLINAVSTLYQLKRLSVHITLVDRGVIPEIRDNHFDRHRSATAIPPVPFSECKHCQRKYSEMQRKIVKAREAKLSLMLAERLNDLESVMWMDPWNASFYDEEGMRESKIVRRRKGKVSVLIDGEKAPLVSRIAISL